MKVLFVHDHIFKRLNECFYSSGGLPASIWPRYTGVFDALTVVGRDGGLLSHGEKGFTVSNADNVNFHLLPGLSDLRSLLLGNKKVDHAVSALVSRHDALIARLPSRLGTLFIKEAIKQSKPYAIEIVGCPWDALWNYGGIKSKLFAPYAMLELKVLAKKTRFALYVTENFLQSRYPADKKATTVFCSNVEIPSVGKKVLASRLEKIFNRPSEQPIIFGQIANYSSKHKGIDVSIRALKEAGLPNWQFKVLGTGNPSFYASLANELGVADRVQFVGSLPSGDPVFNWIDSIDIYLHPSFQEGLPRALVEAMSRGTPALASNIAGIPELLNESELIRSGDYRELADKVREIAQSKNIQSTLANQNFRKVKAYHKNVLDERRAFFWKSFRQYIEDCN